MGALGSAQAVSSGLIEKMVRMCTLLLLLDTARLGLGRSLGLRHVFGFGFGSLRLLVSRWRAWSFYARHDGSK